ncbi:hypothetical protein SAMN04488543_1946 [Friedmanniella luteola]|uniref:Uncharacterized protein n=1 Tax=Friedmanniella luteola TaxID=546871 RepID=A0A1H1T4X0_9ACTN|nr:hypothetical protein SAMN04488543_1946 [Friedmanniella luteola]
MLDDRRKPTRANRLTVRPRPTTKAADRVAADSTSSRATPAPTQWPPSCEMHCATRPWGWMTRRASGRRVDGQCPGEGRSGFLSLARMVDRRRWSASVDPRIMRSWTCGGLTGRHRWVTNEGESETGQAERYQQCDRCAHDPKTSHWSRGDGLDAPGGHSSVGPPVRNAPRGEQGDAAGRPSCGTHAVADRRLVHRSSKLHRPLRRDPRTPPCCSASCSPTGAGQRAAPSLRAGPPGTVLPLDGHLPRHLAPDRRLRQRRAKARHGAR